MRVEPTQTGQDPQSLGALNRLHLTCQRYSPDSSIEGCSRGTLSTLHWSTLKSNGNLRSTRRHLMPSERTKGDVAISHTVTGSLLSQTRILMHWNSVMQIRRDDRTSFLATIKARHIRPRCGGFVDVCCMQYTTCQQIINGSS